MYYREIKLVLIICGIILLGMQCGKLRERPAYTGNDGCRAGECHPSTPMKEIYPETYGKHVAHVEKLKLTCENCHSGYSNASTHKNGKVDDHRVSSTVVFFDNDRVNADATWDVPTTTCNNLACHGSANWYSTDSTNTCGFCHRPGNAFPNAPDPMASGSHSKHAADPSSCVKCHSNYKGSATHANGVLNNAATTMGMVSFSGQPATATYTAGVGCANTACHGNFPGGNNATTPAWGTAGGVSCATSSCHGGNASGNPATSANPDTKHGTHVQNMVNNAINPTTGLNYTEAETCGVCHDGHGVGTQTHANGQVNVGFNYAGGSTGTSTGGMLNATATGFNPVSCSNTYCHGNFPGGNAANVVSYSQSKSDTGWCGSCHTTSPTSVKHSKHLTKFPGQCGYCHQGYTPTSTPASPPSTTHVNFKKDVIFGYPHPLNTAGNPSFDSFTKTCSNVYCHGNFPQVTYNGTSNTNAGNGYNPTWQDSSTSPCGSCHGGPTNNFSSKTHGKHTALSSPYFNNAQHIESCDACHNFGADTDRTFTATSTQGSYNTADHVDFSIANNGVNADVNFKAPDSNLASRTSPGTYTSPRVTSVLTTWTPASTTCSNSWCHGNFEDTLVPMSGNNASPNWLVSSTGACGTCHTTTPPVTNAHPKHLGAPYNYSCSTCHGSHTGHVNGTVAGAGNSIVSFNSMNPNGSFDTGTKQCSNLYCHGNTTGGDWSNFTYSASAKDNDPVWSATGSVGCGTCHDATSATLTTGKHNKHIGNSISPVRQYNYPCRRCHSETLTTDTNNAASLGAGHADGQLHVVFDANNPSGVFDAGAKSCSSTYCHGNFTGGTTSNVSNWVNGTGGNCGDCHDLSPQNANYGSHDKHTNTNATAGYNFDCSTCHNGIAQGKEGGAITLANDISIISTHANFQRNLSFSTLADQGPRTAASYDLVNRTCSGIYCHGDFASTSNTVWLEGNAGNQPVWGGTAVCGTCHGETTGNNAGLGIPNTTTKWHASNESHVKHAGVAAASGNKFPCGFCHLGTYDGTLSNGDGQGGLYEIGPKVPGYTLHSNGVRDFNFNTTFTGASSTRSPGALQEGSCSNMYCHSNGWDLTSTTPDNPGAGLGITPVIWGGAAKSSITCTSCHNNGAGNPAPRNNNTGGGRDHYNPSGSNRHATGCKHCHNYTTESTNIDSNTSDTINYVNRRHVNRWKNVAFGTIHTAPASSANLWYARTNGTCYVTCHVGTGTIKDHNPKTNWYNFVNGAIPTGQMVFEP